MALVLIGRDPEISVDTDDLNDKEYHYFRKIIDTGEVRWGENGGLVGNGDYIWTAIRILTHNLTTEDIESDPKYRWLTD